MVEQRIKLALIKWFSLIIVIIALTNITIFLDIPILRQIFGFIFLTFVPGFLLLFILKMDALSLIEKIILSMGLSVAFSMLFSLALDSSLFAIGYTKPLSTASLLISFSTANIILVVIAYRRNKNITFPFSNFKLTTGEKTFIIVPSLFPLLSIVGIRIMNLTDSNVILLVLLLMIPSYVIFISFINRRVSGKVYPAAIFLIGISLLLMYSLRSNHIIGGDTHLEYFLYQSVLDNLHWGQFGLGPLDALLSISILPVIYQVFLNIDPEYLFKILYSAIFSISPLIVYLLSKRYIGGFYAFLASIFFMSQITFLWTPSYARTNMAILFFGLAILCIFSDTISAFNRRVLFIIFIASIIVSHYGVTYVAFFILLLTYLGMQIISQFTSLRKHLTTPPAENSVIKADSPNFPSQGGSLRESSAITHKATALGSTQAQPRKNITITIVFLFLAILFFWYGQMTGSSFQSGVMFVYRSVTSWEWLAAVEARGPIVQAAIGKTYQYARIPQRIEFIFSWLTIIYIAIGVLSTIRNFKTMVTSSHAGHRKPNFLLKKIDTEYLVLSIMCAILLVAVVALPYVSKYYGSAKTYSQMMVLMSIFFVIGGITITRYLKSLSNFVIGRITITRYLKSLSNFVIGRITITRYLKFSPNWVILVVLVPFFLSTTGVMTQFFNVTRAITLNSTGPLYDDNYVSDGESYAAKWIKEYGEEGVEIYTGVWQGPRILMSQGKISDSQIHPSLIPKYDGDRKIDGYIYLRYVDIVDDILMTKHPDMFADKSAIYANNRSEVYK
ncbi:DUF2206 domain-containing protein [Chloroflexota bacterium]